MTLEAPPGSGKTTVVPLAALDSDWLADKNIIVLQPRRVAARAVAARMSDLLGDSIGGIVGYHVRLDSRVSARTRIEVMTEGLLTRRILADPELSDIGLIVFDEFHERSIHADMGLAFAREIAGALRDDLKILVMSATLGEGGEGGIFAGVPRYSFGGTPHPVQIVYRPATPRLPLWEDIYQTVRDALQRFEGDVLVFLPGMFEIERTCELLERSRSNAVVLALHGELAFEEQQRALDPDPSGRRKIVLATTIAETSLTIDGVRIVVDSGLHKVARGDAHGASQLRTERISRDAADQRTGRAGRTAPGVCIRLWTEQEHQALRPSREPEITRVDVTPAVLDLAVWGVAAPESFAWITPPHPRALQAALKTLKAIGALTADGRATSLGADLSKLGAHPRLGTMALAARALGAERLGAALVTLLEERDLPAHRNAGADISNRANELWTRGSRGQFGRLPSLAQRWLDRISKVRTNPLDFSLPEYQQAGYLLATAFPERIAKRREPGSSRYLLASGAGAALPDGDTISSHEYLVVAHLQDRGDDSRITLAAPLDPALFSGPLTHLVISETEVRFDEVKGALVALTRERCGAITIRERPAANLSPDAMSEALLSWLSTPEGYARIPFSDDVLAFRARVGWLARRLPTLGLPDLSDDDLRSAVAEWLGPFLPAPARLSAITSELVASSVEHYLSWDQRREVDTRAPVSITLPNGRSRRLEYGEEQHPILDATVQELFGWASTPFVGSDRVPLTLRILSPAKRPVQVTGDLAGFWKTGYPEVRKELRGRYPKHKWPEDPGK
jgi:ATP-dependent helicase HrpB